MFVFFLIKIEHDPDKKRRHEMKAWKIVHIGFVENKHTAPQNAFKNWCYAFTLFLILKLNFNFIFYYESTEEEEICKSSVLYMPMRNWFQCIIIQKTKPFPYLNGYMLLCNICVHLLKSKGIIHWVLWV